MSVFNVLNEALVGVEWGFSQVLVFVQVRFQLVNILCMCVCVYQVCVCVFERGFSRALVLFDLGGFHLVLKWDLVWLTSSQPKKCLQRSRES